MQLNILVGLDSRPFILSREFSAYRRLYEDLRVRGVGYEMAPGLAAMHASSHTSGHGKHTTDEGNSSDESSHSGDGATEETPSQAGETEKKSKFGSLLAKATDVLQSRPTRHGSFSEIEIEVPLQYPFPRKFVHQKLSEKDLDDRCAILDKWIRNVMEHYCEFDPDCRVTGTHNCFGE